MNFDEWFVAQHGKRPSNRSSDDLMRERNELASMADIASWMVDACDRWDELRTSALWAWNAKPSA